MKLIIKGRLPGLNEYDKAARGSKFGAAGMKKQYTQLVWALCKEQKLKKVSPTEIIFQWFEPNMKRDKDNVAFAKKFILDGMVKAGILKSDGWKGYGDFMDQFFVDKKNPRVEVEIL